MKTINVEPNWQRIFDYAVAIVRAEIPEDQGQQTVIEMLEFGKRLEAARSIQPKADR